MKTILSMPSTSSSAVKVSSASQASGFVVQVQSMILDLESFVADECLSAFSKNVPAVEVVVGPGPRTCRRPISPGTRPLLFERGLESIHVHIDALLLGELGGGIGKQVFAPPSQQVPFLVSWPAGLPTGVVDTTLAAGLTYSF